MSFRDVISKVICSQGFDLEIIATSKNRCSYIYKGAVYQDYVELPEAVKKRLYDILDDNIFTREALWKLVRIYGKIEAVERICWCLFGSFDSEPDLNLDTLSSQPEISRHCISCQYDKPFCCRCYEPLTRQEQTCFLLYRKGLSDKEIATMLCLSYHTIANHFRNALAKMHDLYGTDVNRAFVVNKLTNAGL